VVSEVLSTGKEGVFLGQGRNTSAGVLINASDGEGLVDAVAEVHIIEENFRVVGLILVCKSVKLIVS